MTLSWWAGAFELILGALITLGLFTRVAAFIAAGEMAFAYWIAHAPQNFFPVNNGGDADSGHFVSVPEADMLASGCAPMR